MEITATEEEPSPIQGRAVFFIRFNPHMTTDVTVPLIDRIRVFIQLIRNSLTRRLSEEDRIGANVIYLFYGEDTNHQVASSRAGATLKISKDVNDPSTVHLDGDILNFNLTDLASRTLDIEKHLVVLENRMKLASSSSRCVALVNVGNPNKISRCGANAKKEHDLCRNHYVSSMAGLPVFLFTEMDQIIKDLSDASSSKQGVVSTK